MRRTKNDSELRASGFRTHLGVVMRSVAAITASVTLVATGLSGDVTPASAANSTPDQNETNAAGAVDDAASTDNDTKKKDSSDSSKDDSTKDSADAAAKLSKAVDQWAGDKSADNSADKPQGGAGDNAAAKDGSADSSQGKAGQDRAAKQDPNAKDAAAKKAGPAPLASTWGFRDAKSTASHAGYLTGQCTGTGDKGKTNCTYYPDQQKLFTPKGGSLPYKYDSSRVCGTGMKVLVDTSTAVTPEEMYQQKQAIFSLMRHIAGTDTKFSMIPFARSVKPAKYFDGTQVRDEPSQLTPVPSNDNAQLDQAARKVDGLTSQQAYTCRSHDYNYGTQCDPHAASSYLTYFRGANYRDAFNEVDPGDTAIMIGEGKPTAPYGRTSVMDIRDIQSAKTAAEGKHIWSFVTGTSQAEGGKNLWFDNYGQMAGPEVIWKANGYCPMRPLVGTGGRFGIGTNPDDQHDETCGSTQQLWPWKRNSNGEWQIDSNPYENIPGVKLLAFADLDEQGGYPDNNTSSHLLWMPLETLNSNRVKTAWFDERAYIYDKFRGKEKNIYWGYGGNGVSLMNTMSDRVDVVSAYGSSADDTGAQAHLPALVANAGKGCDPAQVKIVKRLDSGNGDASNFVFTADNVLKDYTPPTQPSGDLNSSNYDQGVSTADQRRPGTQIAVTDDDGTTHDPQVLPSGQLKHNLRGKILLRGESVFYAKPVESSDIADGEAQNADNSQKVTITESDPSQRGYSIKDVTCTNGAQVDRHGQTFTVKNLQPGEKVTCTVTNSAPDISLTKTPVASGSVKKMDDGYALNLDPNADQFTVSYNVDMKNEQTSGGVVRGDNLTEEPAPIPGYKPVDVSFDNADRNSALIDKRYLSSETSHAPGSTKWVVGKDALNWLRPQQVKTAVVTVTYRKDNSTTDRLRDLLSNDPNGVLTCQGSNSNFADGHGMLNDVSAQKDNRSYRKNSNPVETARACVSITANTHLSVKKVPYDKDSTVGVWVGSKDVTAQYLVTVTNPGSSAVSPSKIVERPDLPAGFTGIDSVEFAPVDSSKLGSNGVQLVRSSYTVNRPDRSGSDKQWVLPANKMGSVPGATSDGPGVGMVKVIVHYSVSGKKSFGGAKQSWTCQANGDDFANGHGAVNRVEVFARQDGSESSQGSANACQDVKEGRVTVHKFVNRNRVQTPQAAQNNAPAQENGFVKIGYRIINDGQMPIKKARISDIALNLKTRNDVEEGDQITIKNLRCNNGWSVDGYDNGVVTVSGPELENGTQINCFWYQKTTELVGSGNYNVYGDRVTVSGTPDDFNPNNDYPSDSNDGWVRVLPKPGWLLTKDGSDDVILGDNNVGDSRDDVVMTYTISLKQTDARSDQFPPSIRETPDPVEGFDIVRVDVEQASDNSLVNRNLENLPDQSRRGEKSYYVIPSRSMNRVGSTPLKATVKVHYRAKSGTSLADFSASDLTCPDDGTSTGGGFNNTAALDKPSPSDTETASACDSAVIVTGSAVKKINGQRSTSQDNSVLVVEGDNDTKNATITYEFTNKSTVPLSTIGISDRLVGKNGRLGDELLTDPDSLSCTVNGRSVNVYTTRGADYRLLVAFPSKLAKGDKVTCTTSLTDAQMGYVQGEHHDRVTITPCQKTGKCGTPVTDDGWSTKVPPLVGELPKTGGSGVGLYGLLSLLLIGLGGFFAAATRRRA